MATLTGIKSLSLQCTWVSIVAFIAVGLSGHRTRALDCVSSCGDIHNIGYPFRLRSDPKHCGDSKFTLECDHNMTVLRPRPSSHVYYYVKAINYDNSTIRVVDPGLDKNNCSSLPSLLLGPFNPFDDGDRPPYSYVYYSDPVIFLKCTNPVNSSRYVNTAPCIKSQEYGYAIQGSISPEDVENGCTVNWTGLTVYWMGQTLSGNISKVSYQDIHDEMVYGFELRYDDGIIYKCSQGQWSYTPGIDHCYPRSIGGFFQLCWQMLVLDYLLRKIVIVASVVGAKLVFGGPFVVALLIHKWRRRHWSAYNTIEDFLHTDNFMPIRYSYSNIKKMSDGFKDKLGQGGFGSVFKCKLRSGHFGAIKVLDKSNAKGEDFMSEVATIGRIHHVNVVQLVGYCVEGSHRALVYDFMPNGSLDRYIFSKEESVTLSYTKMYDIAVGVAQGIEYLHQGCEMQILHFDIKPHNILLDENFVPKISDFGLAKLYPANNSIVSSMAARGTMGYIAPELFYKNIGAVSNKADVYSFGMLLMEMASRRKNLNAFADHSSQIYFPSWVHDQYNDGKDLEIGDATAEEKRLIRKMIVAALWCIQMKPSDRPSMKRVTQMLVGDVEHQELPPKPFLCPQPTPVSNRIPVSSNAELTCTLSGSHRKLVDTGASLGSFVLVLLAAAAYKIYSSDRKEKENQLRIEVFLEDYRARKPSRYSYADIKRITSQFKEKLGQGAYGTVYKGMLSSECFVAVKVLNSTKGDGEEFVNEVGTMGHIHHVNVVRLVGFCADGFRRALVYDFLPNGSLQDFISSADNNSSFFGWDKLQHIALGIAKGVEYLHQGCDQRILHFDIKPHNVLLDHEFTPKISDFGLAKLCSKDQSIVSMTTARGTMGYIAPEVFSRNFGNVSYKSDVYSYGMVLLEMVGGRKNISSTTENTTEVYYPEWIYNLLEEGEDLRIHVGEEADAKIAKRLAIVGLWCIQWHPVDRPSMKGVVQMLEGGENLTMPPNPFASQGPAGTSASTPRLARRLNLQLESIAELE